LFGLVLLMFELLFSLVGLNIFFIWAIFLLGHRFMLGAELIYLGPNAKNDKLILNI